MMGTPLQGEFRWYYGFFPHESHAAQATPFSLRPVCRNCTSQFLVLVTPGFVGLTELLRPDAVPHVSRQDDVRPYPLIHSERVCSIGGLRRIIWVFSAF